MRIGRLPRTGKMFELPADARAALERTLAHPLRAIKMIDYSRNSRLHRGMVATTRPGCILLCGSGEDFLADPEFVCKSCAPFTYDNCRKVRQGSEITRRAD